MPPTTQNTLTAPDGGAIDPSVVAMMAGIKQQESGVDYNAKGKDGEIGAYQWLPSTFAAQAKQYGLDPNDMSSTNQNKLAYSVIDGYKKQGLTPEQIASKWNSGDPNGYQEPASMHPDNNVAQYTANVMKYATKYAQSQGLAKAPTSNLASQQIQPATAGLPSMPSAATPGQTQGGGLPGLPNMPAAASVPPSPLGTQAPAPTGDPSGGFLSGLQEDLNGSNPDTVGTQLENTAKGIGNFLLPSIGDTYNDLTGKNNKTVLQQFGDAGSTLLGIASVIPGLDAIADPLEALRGADVAGEVASKAAPGLLSAVGKNAALGGAFGVSGALGQGKTNVGDIATSGLIGAATGGVLGGIGHGVSGLLESEAGKTGEANLREFTTVRKTLNKALIDNSKDGTDPITTAAQNGWIKELRPTQGKLDANALTNENGTGLVDSAIQQHADDADAAIKSLPGGVLPADFLTEAQEAIKADPNILWKGNTDDLLAKAENKINSITKYAPQTPEGISYENINQIRKGMNQDYNQDTRDASRVIGDVARKYLYTGGKTNDAIRSSMANEAELIRLRNYLQRIHGTPMGKGMQKIAHEIIGSGIGGTIGSIGGPIGAGVGAAATGAATKMAEDAISSNKFDPLGAKVAGGLLNASKKPLAQVAGRATKVGVLRGVSGL